MNSPAAVIRKGRKFDQVLNGAREVFLASSKRFALMHELREEDEPVLEDLLAKLAPVDLVLIEGAGGFYSPLAENGLNADLAVALQLPVLLVADDRLGALSQVLLNVEAIQMRGLPLAGVVMNQLEESHSEHMDNTADLRERLDCPVFHNPYSIDGEVELPDAIIDSLLSPSKSKGPYIQAVG